MKVRPLTREEARSIDVQAAHELELPTLVLMENAGRGAAQCIREQTQDNARVLILCGPGNNGGDGGVVARHLDAWGYSVCVIWFGHPEQFSRDAAIQYGILSRAGILQRVQEGALETSKLNEFLAETDWVVDGLLGTGLARPVEGVLRAVIEAMNRSKKPILALDLPSGLDSDTGQPQGVAVRAALTATFVAPKVGFSKPGAVAYTGPVRVVEIGVPRRLLEGFREG